MKHGSGNLSPNVETPDLQPLAARLSRPQSPRNPPPGTLLIHPCRRSILSTFISGLPRPRRPLCLIDQCRSRWALLITPTCLPLLPWHLRNIYYMMGRWTQLSTSQPLSSLSRCIIRCMFSLFVTWPSFYMTTPFRIRMFIEHRKQCCFYTNVSRFDPSSSATVFQNSPPSPALMSVIYLLGSFFAGLKSLEMKLLEQTLHDIARILHNQEQLVDMVQALCLLAEYFYFNNRDIEGSRHLNAAKRLALELHLHQVTRPTFLYDVEFQSDFGPWDSERQEQAAVFWQMFMVDSLWSATNDCSLQADLEFPCPNITTPLPIEDGLDPVC